jgi:hypothetical protein
MVKSPNVVNKHQNTFIREMLFQVCRKKKILLRTPTPSYYEEAVSNEHKNEWSEAIQDEMKSLYENDTFELVSLPKGKKALKNKWVYKMKTEEHMSYPRYTRLD